jgi:hypothetical protein
MPSPQGRLLYPIERLSARNVTSYRLRAYDLVAHRLLPRVIADKRQKGSTIRGIPFDRVVDRDGRWVCARRDPIRADAGANRHAR